MKNAGIPAPPHRIRSASVPCGHSSTAISPPKYFFSKILLFPRYDRISRLTWPVWMSVARPPLSGTPALLDTAVKECRSWRPRRAIAAIRVSA